MTTAITISKVKQNDKPEKSMYNSYYKDMVIRILKNQKGKIHIPVEKWAKVVFIKFSEKTQSS